MLLEQECLRTSYAADGYVCAKQIFSKESLTILCQSLRAILEKAGVDSSDHSSTLDDLILNCEKQDHNIVYHCCPVKD